MPKKCVLVNIFDSVGKTHSAPMLFENEDCAKRYFATLLVNNPNKDDYKLCFLCYYSVELGALVFTDNNGDDDFYHSDLLMKGSEING